MENQSTSSGPLRKRGRPAGKNRVPLSLEEKRARNAQYERERRNANADAMAELATASGCDPGMSNADLIASVVTFLQRASRIEASEQISSLRRCNEKLIMQIQTLEQRLTAEELAALNASLSEEESDEDNYLRTLTNKQGCKKLKQVRDWPQQEVPSPLQSSSSVESQVAAQWLKEETSSPPAELSPSYYPSTSDCLGNSSHFVQAMGQHFPSNELPALNSSHYNHEPEFVQEIQTRTYTQREGQTRVWPQEEGSSLAQSTFVPVEPPVDQWPKEECPSPPTGYTTDSYATSAYLTCSTHLGVEHSELMESLQTPWIEPEVKVEEGDTDGEANWLQHWSIEDIIDEYL